MAKKCSKCSQLLKQLDKLTVDNLLLKEGYVNSADRRRLRNMDHLMGCLINDTTMSASTKRMLVEHQFLKEETK